MTNQPYFTFDVAAFRAEFTQFAGNPPSDATLQSYFNTAGSYVTNSNYGWLNGIDRALALNLMTAHIAALMALAAAPGGSTPGVVTGATIDKISVTLEPPPTKNGWQYWLAQTPYGQMLWALLTVKSTGGFFVGGSPTRAGFRGNGRGAC